MFCLFQSIVFFRTIAYCIQTVKTLTPKSCLTASGARRTVCACHRTSSACLSEPFFRKKTKTNETNKTSNNKDLQQNKQPLPIPLTTAWCSAVVHTTSTSKSLRSSSESTSYGNNARNAPVSGGMMRIRFVKKKTFDFCFWQVRSDGFLTFSNLSNVLFENPSLFPLPLILGFSDRCHNTSPHCLWDSRSAADASPRKSDCFDITDDRTLQWASSRQRFTRNSSVQDITKKTIIVSMYCSLIAHMFNTLHPQKESSLLLVRMEMFSSPQKHWEDDIGPSTTMGYPRLSF